MNPYDILGVSPSASDDDIKKAYKALSRKYHPDANINSPNQQLAEEKFKQVQQAYSQIMDQRKRGGTGYGNYGNTGSYGSYGGSNAGGSGTGYDGDNRGGFGDFGGFGGFGGFGDFGGFGNFGGYGGYSNSSSGSSNMTEDDMHLNAAANYINSRHYAEAVNVLNSIANRTAKWYYYSALANKGLGNNVQALEHAKKAAEMEPGNITFQRLVQSFESGGQWYTSQQQSFGGMPSAICGNPLLFCCCANLCCNSCCYGGRYM